jgi:hypothetical protein
MGAGSVLHPRPDIHGRPVTITHPHEPSAPETWTDHDAVATFIPDGAVPGELNGVAFAPWPDAPQTPERWADVLGQRSDPAEPPLPTGGGKHLAAGAPGRLFDDGGRCLAGGEAHKYLILM